MAECADRTDNDVYSFTSLGQIYGLALDINCMRQDCFTSIKGTSLAARCDVDRLSGDCRPRRLVAPDPPELPSDFHHDHTQVHQYALDATVYVDASMIPLPGSPSASWALFKQQVVTRMNGPQVRIATAFFLFGLLNNVFGVIILSAALDLVGPQIPKGTVLLATILPGVCTKLTLPYVIQTVPYSLRIIVFSVVTTIGMLLVALTPVYQPGQSVDFGLAVGAKVFGITLASLSSGTGELSFLGLTHFYGSTSLAAWGSGTGAAGLVGAGAYALITGPFGVSVRTTLLGSALWPFGMAVAYFAILPLGPMKLRDSGRSNALANGEDNAWNRSTDTNSPHGRGDDDEEDTELARSDQALLASSHEGLDKTSRTPWITTARANLRRARGLVVPFMLPLFIVYVGEYTINQGVTPTLLFPVPSSSAPFEHYREFYPAYATIYQLGVFVSRSSIFFPSLRFHALYLPSMLQWANLVFLVAHAMYNFLPNVWVIFLVIFWEGLLGGGVYVNTFAEILDRVPEEEREFSLGATSVSDSLGILLAAFLSMALEKSLCAYQQSRGRDYCTRT